MLEFQAALSKQGTRRLTRWEPGRSQAETFHDPTARPSHAAMHAVHATTLAQTSPCHLGLPNRHPPQTHSSTPPHPRSRWPTPAGQAGHLRARASCPNMFTYFAHAEKINHVSQSATEHGACQVRNLHNSRWAGRTRSSSGKASGPWRTTTLNIHTHRLVQCALVRHHKFSTAHWGTAWLGPSLVQPVVTFPRSLTPC